MPALDPLPFFLWKQPRLLVDVRPAAIFRKGSLENARSIPEDRYANKEDLLNEIKKLQNEGPVHLIDRDGTRSEYLSQSISIKYLKGGYEAFKIWRDLAFDAGPPLYLLGGYSGSGKTEFLEHLENNHQVINLESIGGHKGSIFGSSHTQPLHDTFQNTLLHLWYSMETNAPVWIEEKGPFLGQIGLPSSLYKRMLDTPMIHLDVPFEQRLAHCLQTYQRFDNDKFRHSLQSLEERMGTSQNHKALHFLRRCWCLMSPAHSALVACSSPTSARTLSAARVTRHNVFKKFQTTQGCNPQAPRWLGVILVKTLVQSNSLLLRSLIR